MHSNYVCLWNKTSIADVNCTLRTCVLLQQKVQSWQHQSPTGLGQDFKISSSFQFGSTNNPWYCTVFGHISVCLSKINLKKLLFFACMHLIFRGVGHPSWKKVFFPNSLTQRFYKLFVELCDILLGMHRLRLSYWTTLLFSKTHRWALSPKLGV